MLTRCTRLVIQQVIKNNKFIKPIKKYTQSEKLED